MGKHGKVLAAVFTDPIRDNIKWRDIEAMLKHHGADISEAAGSRGRVVLGTVRAVFHRPHPRPTNDKGAVASVRRLLEAAGVKP